MLALTPVEILEKVHVRYEGDTSYPTVGDEDHTVRLAHLDDAVSTIEREVMQGIKFDFLKEEETLSASGTRTDALPTDFLGFLTDYIKAGNAEYVRTTKERGAFFAQSGSAPYVFWREGSNLRSLPALSGTVTYPYLRTLTRFPVGDEVTTADGDGKYYVEFILAMLYLDDGDLNQYNVHANNAKDILDFLKGEAITDAPNQSQFGFGM